ncbi:MAG: hypothetical protein O3B09_01570 [Proteobacteria bacterium]|nr:hypothetical protein [Pseudomonadota bacterium]
MMFFSIFQFSKPIIKGFIITLLITFVNSCSNRLEQSNESFLSEYGSDVENITSKRQRYLSGESFRQVEEISRGPEWRNSGDILGVSGPINSSSAFVDTSNIELPKPKEQFSPDLQTFERGRVSKSLPVDMFKISYNMNLYPDSYRKKQVSFDDINIPGYDAYGVETDLGNKEYMLVDKEALQENIDYLDYSTTKDDKEISLILINEQRDIKKKRMMGIVGGTYQESDYGSKDYEKKNDNKEKEEVADDSSENVKKGETPKVLVRRLIKK